MPAPRNRLFVVNAFTKHADSGNPAAVCLLCEPKSDSWMAELAKELQFSETAFVQVPAEQGANTFGLRWFTPTCEVDLCGHATLASASILWQKVCATSQKIFFETKSGTLAAKQQEEGWTQLDFPVEFEDESSSNEILESALGVDLLYLGKSRFDYLGLVDSVDTLLRLNPSMELLKKLDARGVIVTSPDDSESPYDFQSRFFAPQSGIDEDAVTGSAHCTLGPFWKKRLKKTDFFAYQASSRGGEIKVSVQGDRVMLQGQTFFVKELEEPK